MIENILSLMGSLIELAWLYCQLYALRAHMQLIALAAWLQANPHQAAGCALGLTGAFLLACKARWSSLGWLAFLASNAVWIYYAWHRDIPGLLVQQIGFTATSLLGIWTWLIKPQIAKLRGPVT